MSKTHALTSMNKLKLIIVALLIATVFTGITVVASSSDDSKCSVPTKIVLVRHGETS